MNRRLFLKGVGAVSATALLTPTMSFASMKDWPTDSMNDTSLDNIMATLGNGAQETTIGIKAPQIAENGATVPVEVNASKVPGTVKNITFLVSNNPRPVAASFNLNKGAVPIVGSRIKIGKSSDFIVLVTTDKGVFTDKREVKVTIGGCGG